jgi:frataxin-like iron-binding protein CyaY
MGIEASNGARDLLSRQLPDAAGLWIATGCHGPHIDSKHQQTLP